MIAWFGDLGGIQQFIWLIINGAIGFLIERRVMSKLVGDLFTVQNYTVDQSEYYATSRGKDGQTELPTIPDDSEDDDDGTG